MRDFRRLLLLAPLLLLVVGCQHLTPIFGTRAASEKAAREASDQTVRAVCRTFPPINYSRLDTPETTAQVQAHNRAWVTLCNAPGMER